MSVAVKGTYLMVILRHICELDSECSIALLVADLCNTCRRVQVAPKRTFAETQTVATIPKQVSASRRMFTSSSGLGSYGGSKSSNSVLYFYFVFDASKEITIKYFRLR